jgi:hypothetical protein
MVQSRRPSPDSARYCGNNFGENNTSLTPYEFKIESTVAVLPRNVGVKPAASKIDDQQNPQT